ncbi:hypothetical protein DH2020_046242 [Rehmannia glutinosa]|uniref:Uncharacterized protein n=1 Tax=Rehmannia glutinosa TaxID=99300 RepID=A0ABR0UC27_REHGL
MFKRSITFIKNLSDVSGRHFLYGTSTVRCSDGLSRRHSDTSSGGAAYYIAVTSSVLRRSDPGSRRVPHHIADRRRAHPAPGAATPTSTALGAATPGPSTEAPPADGSNDGFVSRAAIGGTALAAALVAVALM